MGLKGAERITNEELLEVKCDILVPAALENQITLKNAAASGPASWPRRPTGPPRRAPTACCRTTASS